LLRHPLPLWSHTAVPLNSARTLPQ
jgi:hypothetical protein